MYAVVILALVANLAGPAGGPRPVRDPVVVVERHPDAPPSFQVRVRFDRPLPADRQGPRANFSVGRAGSDAAPAPFGRPARHCYASSVGNDADDPRLRDAAPGDRATLTIRIAGRPAIARRVTLRSSRYVRLRTLGCGVRR